MNTNLPEDIKEAIQKEYPLFDGGEWDLPSDNLAKMKREAAEFGYLLSLKNKGEDDVTSVRQDEEKSLATLSSSALTQIEQIVVVHGESGRFIAYSEKYPNVTAETDNYFEAIEFLARGLNKLKYEFL